MMQGRESMYDEAHDYDPHTPLNKYVHKKMLLFSFYLLVEYERTIL
jgi:hypothetical protein